jgi:hypothetical protein
MNIASTARGTPPPRARRPTHALCPSRGSGDTETADETDDSRETGAVPRFDTVDSAMFWPLRPSVALGSSVTDSNTFVSTCVVRVVSVRRFVMSYVVSRPQSARDLGLSSRMEKVRSGAAAGCGWHFFDTTAARQRHSASAGVWAFPGGRSVGAVPYLLRSTLAT